MRKGQKMTPEQRERLRIARWVNPPLTDQQKRELNRQRCRAYYEADKDRGRKRAAKWYRDNPERARAYRYRYVRENVEAARERYNRWMAVPENRTKAFAKLGEYRRAHPELTQKYEANRRARLRGAFIEDVDRTVVLARYNGLCGICGEAVDPERFDVDHIIPLLVGGEHSYANTQPAHPSCNYRKPKRPKEIAA